MWIGVLLLAGLAIFVVWDSRRLRREPVKHLSRATMRAGYAPQGMEGWHFWFGMGLITTLMAFMEWDSPSVRPETGRWGWLWNMVFQAFGDRGKFVMLLGFAVLMLIVGLTGLLSAKKRERKNAQS